MEQISFDNNNAILDFSDEEEIIDFPNDEMFFDSSINEKVDSFSNNEETGADVDINEWERLNREEWVDKWEKVNSLDNGDMELDSWIGNYYFHENWPHINHNGAMFISYYVIIYKEEGKYYADIYAYGHLTYIQAIAIIIGDESGIDFIFKDYSPWFPRGRWFYYGEVLFSFSIKEDQIHTTWHAIKCQTAYVTGETTGIYFEETMEDLRAFMDSRKGEYNPVKPEEHFPKG
jgi:hypothetical protein